MKEEVKKEGKSGLEEAWLDSETVSFQEFVRVTDLIQAFDLSTPRHKKELPGLAPKAFLGLKELGKKLNLECVFFCVFLCFFVFVYWGGRTTNTYVFLGRSIYI